MAWRRAGIYSHRSEAHRRPLPAAPRALRTEGGPVGAVARVVVRRLKRDGAFDELRAAMVARMEDSVRIAFSRALSFCPPDMWLTGGTLGPTGIPGVRPARRGRSCGRNLAPHGNVRSLPH